MTNNLGETIRRLRKLHDITQETLADAVGVTIPAVSKWERGECLPDVTLIVPLASYFGITTDELLGVSEEVRRAKIQKWYDDYKPYICRQTKEIAQAHFDGLLALMEEFPNDFELMNAYIVFAVLDPEFYGEADQTEKSRKKNFRRIEECCRTILEKCTDECKRQEAFSELAELYASDGRLEEGEKLLMENVPFELRHQKIAALYNSVDHPDTPDKFRNTLYYQMKSLLETITFYLDWVKPVEKKRDLYRRTIAMIQSFCGDDLGTLYFHTAYLCHQACADFTNAGLLDEAMEAAEICLRDIHRYDGLPEKCTFTTGIIEGYTKSTVDGAMEAADMTETEFMLGLFEQNWAAPLREREDFRALLERYRLR
ncbi:MAG: helix-turn-helix transcriptional regulator [Clostridia bacterium]|nr:helix-turn-helix transcriptional regulator [Clostridia bacterium]